MDINYVFPPPSVECAFFAAGCFWTVEHMFSEFPGVVSTQTGFTGGHVANPSYEEVCHKNTGHCEAVAVCFDTEKTDFEALARFFFEIHDPERDRRDRGGQYRSAIFYTRPSQRDIADRLVAHLQKKGLSPTTTIAPAGPFYPASERHQGYYCRLDRLPKLRKRVERF